MLWALICPSSGVCDYVVELPHWLISFLVCCVLELGCGSARVVSVLPAEAQLVPGTGSFLGLKQPGHGINHPPLSNTVVKERV